MTKESDIILTWEYPKKIRKHEANKLFREGRTAVPRLLIIALAVLLTIYLFLKDFYPQEERYNLIKLFCIAFLYAVGFALFAYVIYPLMQRFSNITCQFTSKGIRVTGERPWKITWEELQRYSLSSHDKIYEIKVLTLHYKKGKKHLYLPEDKDEQETIITEIKERTPTIEVTEFHKRIELTKQQYAFLITLTMFYSIVISYLFVSFQIKTLLIVAWIVPMWLGPGTIGLLILYGSQMKKKTELWIYAFAFNMLSSCFIMLFSALMALYQI